MKHVQSKLNQAEVADIITSHKKLRGVLTHLGNLFQCLHFFPLLFLFIAAFALCFLFFCFLLSLNAYNHLMIILALLDVTVT